MNGFKQNEINARLAIEATQAREASEYDQTWDEALEENTSRNKARAIEERIVGGDVQRLNDEAEIKIYGSRGRTIADPTTGEKIADKDNPIVGRLELMRQEPAGMLGRPQSERDEATKKREEDADKYEEDLLKLVNIKGLELCQALIVMDLREKDAVEKLKLAKAIKEDGVKVTGGKKFVDETVRDKDGNAVFKIDKDGNYEDKDGNKIKKVGDNEYTDKDGNSLTLDEVKRVAVTKKEKVFAGNKEISPAKKASEQYKKLDARRIRILKEEGAFTMDEYRRASTGEDLYIDSGDGTDPNRPDVSELEDSWIRSTKILSDPKYAMPMLEDGSPNPDYNPDIIELAYLTNELTDLATARERSIFTPRKTKRKLAEAQKRYEELRTRVDNFLQDRLEEEGYSGEEIDQAVFYQDRAESMLLPEIVRCNTERLAKESRFVSWWQRQKGVKGMLMKAGVMVPAGIVAGVALAPIAGAGIGAATATFLTTRIARNAARAGVSGRADAATLAQERRDSRRREQLDALQQDYDTPSIPDGEWVAESVSDSLVGGVNSTVRSNRKRTAKSTAIGMAVGAVAGEVMDEVTKSSENFGEGLKSFTDEHGHGHVVGPEGVGADHYKLIEMGDGDNFFDSVSKQYDMSPEEISHLKENLSGEELRKITEGVFSGDNAIDGQYYASDEVAKAIQDIVEERSGSPEIDWTGILAGGAIGAVAGGSVARVLDRDNRRVEDERTPEIDRDRLANRVIQLEGDLDNLRSALSVILNGMTPEQQQEILIQIQQAQGAGQN